MKKIFIINAGLPFGGSEGKFNRLLATCSEEYFKEKGALVKVTHLEEGYSPENEVSKFVWADLIIYHTPIWWFSVPYQFKEYIDKVFSAGMGKGMFTSDGRTRLDNPKLNYGKGGSLQGRKYLLTTSWNAPLEAFTVKGELFNETSVDDGTMFGFHIMNRFIGLEALPSYHFYDVMKDPHIEEDKLRYIKHLNHVM